MKCQFLIKLIQDTVSYREQKMHLNVVSMTMDILIKLKNEDQISGNSNETGSGAGFETSSTTMRWSLFELQCMRTFENGPEER